jgi:hypothetical protein
MRRLPAAFQALLLLTLPAAASGQVKASAETAGTVVLGEGPARTVRVEATYEEDLGAPREGWRRTLTRVSFSDRTGRLLYQETYETRMTAGQGFDGELSVAPAVELRGATRRFVLLTLGFDPSTPSGGTTLQIYGFDAKGHFRRFGPSIAGPGTRLENPVDQTGRVSRLREGRYLDVAEWTSHFTLTLPWRFDEGRGDWELASLCGTVKVEPREPESGTVELHRTPGPGAQDLRVLRPYKKVPVRPSSKVEFLNGCRRYADTPGGPRYTPWIRVRVDGEEGWVVNDALDVLGLPTAD